VRKNVLPTDHETPNAFKEAADAEAIYMKVVCSQFISTTNSTQTFLSMREWCIIVPPVETLGNLCVSHLAVAVRLHAGWLALACRVNNNKPPPAKRSCRYRIAAR